jgi:hypothetical protein
MIPATKTTSKLDTNPRLEALLESLANLKGWMNPDAYTYQIKNPLLIKSYAPAGKHQIDENGVRIFSNWLGGYRACLYDLAVKVSGRSVSGVGRADRLSDLLKVYEIKERLGQQQVVKYLRRALKDDSVSLDTEIGFFRG